MGEILDALVNDLGMSGLRQEQHDSQALETTNDNADPNVIVQSAFNSGFEAAVTLSGCTRFPHLDSIPKIAVPFRTRVRANGDPFDYYISFIYFNLTDMPAHWQSNPAEAAEAFHAYAIWFNSLFGFYPSNWTWNEPGGGFSGGGWLGKWTNFLGDRLVAAGIPACLEVPNMSTPGVSATDAVFAETGATQRTCRIAWHSYDFGQWPDAAQIAARNALRSRAISNGKETGMGEICCRGGWTATYAQGKDIARSIFLEMTEGRVSTWEMLAIMGPCTTNNCVAGIDGGQDPINIANNLSEFYKNPHYYVLRQYFNRSWGIRPGYVRVDHSCASCGSGGPSSSSSIKPVAFKRPNGTVVVVILNDTSSAQTVQLNGLPNGNYTIHKLDPTMCSTSGPRARCIPASSTFSGASQSIAMPADAVWTVAQN